VTFRQQPANHSAVQLSPARPGAFAICYFRLNLGDRPAARPARGVEHGFQADGLAYDGIGADYEAVTGKVWLNLPLN
jgi:hypothetical protein